MALRLNFPITALPLFNNIKCVAKSVVPLQVTHSLSQEKIEMLESLDNWVEKNILMHLKHVEKCWQPQDFLPDAESDGFYEQVKELRERSEGIPDEIMIALIGEMITEEALPTYLSMLNSLEGVRDKIGASLTSWATWSRAWTAEENRHGDLLNKYLYLSGRVDMRQVEKTIQYLIGSGMDPKVECDPYRGFIYTSFQERATFTSHANTASLVKAHGDLKLAQICRTIAADEKRHETAYTKIMEKLFEVDPDHCVIAFADVMAKRIAMPGEMMFDGKDSNLFGHFSVVTQRLGVYSIGDYIEILEFLVARWNVEKLTNLSDEGRKAQDYVCRLALRIKKLEEKTRDETMQIISVPPFSWMFCRKVTT